METVGEERVRAAKSLQQLEEAAQHLEDASNSQTPRNISVGFPSRVSGILNELTAISSRDDAERLLALGVSLWNSAIAFETHTLEQSTAEALVKVRHVAADCMYMSTTVLGGISARYNIDNVSLMKFYTACGQKYAADLSDTEMAEVCFSKAAEFANVAKNSKDTDEMGTKDYAKAMFDLLLGRAECAWERAESEAAEGFVTQARYFLTELPDEHEFLASVEYNFGLFTYQANDVNRALEWLERSMQTRSSEKNTALDAAKQARTGRLAGVCLLALQRYDDSWNMMKKAEETCHDPVGSYLLLKLSVITKRSDAFDLLLKIVQDLESNLDVCIASVCLFNDAQRVSEASAAYEKLFQRYQNDPKVVVCTIGPRFFETLCALGKRQDALDVLKTCTSAINELESADETAADATQPGSDISKGADKARDIQLGRWSDLLLATGSAMADRKDFGNAAEFLDRALHLSKMTKRTNPAGKPAASTEGFDDLVTDAVTQNEAAVCRLASSCALCSIGSRNDPPDMSDIQRVDSQIDHVDFNEAEKKALALAKRHAQRAKELEPDDFTARLLLFRVHLMYRDFTSAASELHTASAEMKRFDPGAVAEAACAANDVGSSESVVAALRCILKMDPSIMCSSLESSGSLPSKGFVGTVLLSCVNIFLKGIDIGCKNGTETSSGEEVNVASITPAECQKHDMLLDTLQAGKRCLEHTGLELGFENSKKTMEGLSYLMDVAWNAGRFAGARLQYARWDAFFNMCYAYGSMLPKNMSTLQTRRMSKLMCACAKIENPSSKKTNFEAALDELREARGLSQIMRELSPTSEEDPISGLVLTLEARCCVGSRNMESLAAVVQEALTCKDIAPGALEQLASICYNFPKLGDSSEGERRSQCTNLTTALLSRATDIRLCQAVEDIEALAVTMREHLGIELSRGANTARSYKVFQKAVGAVLEFGEKFPRNERRWLVAVGWDRAQMHKRLTHLEEAKRWCEGVMKLIEGCMALSTYRPRLQALMISLGMS